MKITKIKTKDLDFSYPIKDKNRLRFLRHPGINDNGKWEAVDVNIYGGFWRLVAPLTFNTEKMCQKVCDVHNKYPKFTEKQALYILNLSFGIKKLKEITL